MVPTSIPLRTVSCTVFMQRLTVCPLCSDITDIMSVRHYEWYCYNAGMKIYSWNVNGIRAVLNKGALQEFIKKYQPDILLLQETKAQQGQAQTDFKDYDEYWSSAEKKGYSGTAIFTKIKPLQVINGLPRDI